MDHQQAPLQPGDVVADRYEVIEELGRGSYGIVFRATQLGIGRDVALKTLLPETGVGSEERKRFEREALAVSRFNHPNIVTLFDYGDHEGTLFMVMEYVHGRELKEVIDEEAPMEPARVRSIVYQMLDALQYAHDQGVVHRDLKPENIQLLDERPPGIDEPQGIKVLDFGIAKFVHGDEDGSALDTLTQTGVAMGTPQYMSPENIIGDPVSRHADIYAVGLLLYEMLVGEPAFTGENPHEVMVSHIKDDAPRLPDTAQMQPFRRALQWALQKQPDERVPSAHRFRELLQEDAPPPELGSETVETSVSVDSAQSSLVKPLVAVVLAALVVIVLLVLFLLQANADPSSTKAVETQSPPESAEQIED